MNHPFLLIIVKVTIFSLMLAMGIKFSLETMFSFWRKPALLFRALLAVVVLVPLVVVALLKLFNLPLGVAMGLVFLAASPGAPLTTKRTKMAGAKSSQSASLQLTLALLAVIITPLTLAIFTILFQSIPEKLTMLDVAKQVTIVQLLPVSLGLLLQKFGANYAVRVEKSLTFIANFLFFILVILACIIGFPLLFKLWGLPLVVITIMVIVSLGIGHILGGPDEDHRSILAISCIARNIGLALFITILNGLEKQVIPTIVAYLMVGAVLGVLYSIYHKRKLAKLP
ncbi:bile acid:sodium symporter [Synechocystis salina]|uniref:Sodium dependent transporter n=1 Tax=Synechocystis salina LEGE 00031 TaxID=1828736 RepID=A0ABR9VNK6_9SYNC|nr:bile acid:sodium symporter [Synechocystis salina]MBE9242117.1 sodium dependent transporter [Synechocystis salina LEGE 00041]MBE9252920.1 sodium dependent transporter [Synechocystis salina LEGE 00031]